MWLGSSMDRVLARSVRGPEFEFRSGHVLFPPLCHRSTVWLGSSLVRVLARYATGPGFESRSGHVLFSSSVTFGGSVWVRARAASSKGTVSSVPAWFRADSGTNLIKRGEIVTGRPCGSVAQWSGCSLGMREVLGSSLGRAMCFFLPCDIWLLSVGPCSGCEQQRVFLVGSGMVPSRFGDESN